MQERGMGGRTDLVYIAQGDAKIDWGRFAIVRIQHEKCSWIEDFLVNYADQYNEVPRGPHYI